MQRLSRSLTPSTRLSRPEDAWYKQLFHTVRKAEPTVDLDGEGLPVGNDDYEIVCGRKVLVRDFGTNKLVWHVNNESHPGLGLGRNLAGRAERSAHFLASYDEFALVELMAGKAEAFLHPEVDCNCADGLSLYSSGRPTAHNLVTGSGITAKYIEDDWSSAVLKFFRNMHNEGQPYWEDMNRLLVVAPPQLSEVMAEVFSSQWPSQRSRQWPIQVELVIWEQLKSPINWHVFVLDEKRKPFAKVDRLHIRVAEWNQENADWSRETKQNALQWQVSLGYGCLDYHTTIKVNND